MNLQGRSMLRGIPIKLIMKLKNENWDLFLSKLKQVQTNENGIIACCPAHEDKNPSLSASYTDETILVKCHAGCTFEEIVSSVGMDSSQFFPYKAPPKELVAKYRYEDKDGKHGFDVIRYEPKDFRPQSPDGDEPYDIHWYNKKIKYDIEPLLHEYWFDQPEHVEELVTNLTRDN